MTDDQREQDTQEAAPPTAEQLDDYREVKLGKLKAMQDAGQDPFREVRYDRSHCAADIEAGFDELDGKMVTIAGRLVAKRVQGKAGFADLIDESGRIQLYVKQDHVGEAAFELYKKLDLGDILGVTGVVMKTRTGQVTVSVREYKLLAKILQTLPEKWHGLQDADQRMRQRYADVIVNREVFTRLRLRSKAVSEIRRFLDARGFLEVETPMLHPIAGGATAEPFKTYWNALKSDFYLRIAIELHLKRLIVGGLERVYEIGRVFRNEGVSTRHNPEFTMLELYWAYTDYTDIMQLTEDLIVHTADTVFKSREIEYGEYTLNLTTPFKRMKFDEALREYAGCGLDQLKNLEDVKREATRLKIDLPVERGYAHCLDEIFKETVEPHLVQPTFIYDYPAALSPLAKAHPDNPEMTYRFELFIACMELANSFSELNDPLDQRERFTQQINEVIQQYWSFIPELRNVESKAEWRKKAEQLGAAGHAQVVKLVHAYTAPVEIDEKVLSTIDFDAISKFVFMNRVFSQFSSATRQMVSFESLRPVLEEFCGRFPKHPGVRQLEQALDVTRFDQRLDDDFLAALEFGMPPTGGLGIGIDRLMMLLSGTPSIREVMWFPQLKQR